MGDRRHTVVETPGFIAQAKREGMSDDERVDLVSFLAENPTSGDLIVGSGGCRKLRFARAGGGRSGGYRAVTFFEGEDGRVFLLAMLAKGSRANFSATEVKAMADATAMIKAAMRAARKR